MTLMKLRLDFRFNILECIWLSLYSSFLFMGMKRCPQVICVMKLKVIQPQPKYKTINFPNLESLNKKFSSRLADFGYLRRWGVWMNPINNENS